MPSPRRAYEATLRKLQKALLAHAQAPDAQKSEHREDVIQNALKDGVDHEPPMTNDVDVEAQKLQTNDVEAQKLPTRQAFHARAEEDDETARLIGQDDDANAKERKTTCGDHLCAQHHWGVRICVMLSVLGATAFASYGGGLIINQLVHRDAPAPATPGVPSKAIGSHGSLRRAVPAKAYLEALPGHGPKHKVSASKKATGTPKQVHLNSWPGTAKEVAPSAAKIVPESDNGNHEASSQTKSHRNTSPLHQGNVAKRTRTHGTKAHTRTHDTKAHMETKQKKPARRHKTTVQPRSKEVIPLVEDTVIHEKVAPPKKHERKKTRNGKANKVISKHQAVKLRPDLTQSDFDAYTVLKEQGEKESARAVHEASGMADLLKPFKEHTNAHEHGILQPYKEHQGTHKQSFQNLLRTANWNEGAFVRARNTLQESSNGGDFLK